MSLLEVITLGLVNLGLGAFFCLFLLAGLALWKANGRTPVNLLKLKYVEPSPKIKRPNPTAQKVLAAICMIIGIFGILNSLINLAEVLL